MGSADYVKRVKIYNRIDGTIDDPTGSVVSSRLSNSVVSLINQNNVTLKTYMIGDARNIAEFEFSSVD